MMPPILPAMTVVAVLLETAEGSRVSGIVAVELFSFSVVPVLACAVVDSGSGVVVEMSDGYESAFSSVSDTMFMV